MGMGASYPHKTAALCAGCILQCTCRIWWLGRWGDTAGNSLRCYYCKDWCLEIQKQRANKTNQRLVTGINRCALDTHISSGLHAVCTADLKWNKDISSSYFFCRAISQSKKRLKKPPEKLACSTKLCTFLHSFIINFHVHHGRSAVPQDFPVSTVLLVTGSYLVSSLVRPPQLVSYRTQRTWGWSAFSIKTWSHTTRTVLTGAIFNATQPDKSSITQDE